MREAERLPEHLERKEAGLPPYGKLTVAEYLLWKLYQLGVSRVQTVDSTPVAPFVKTAATRGFVCCLPWGNVQKAIWAGCICARSSGYGAVYLPETFIPELLRGLIESTYSVLPMVFIIGKTLREETKELCGSPLGTKEKARRDLRQIIRRFTAAHIVLEDRHTAAARIDRCIDTSLELNHPVVIELSDEVAQAYIPPHIYRKTVFNHEDGDLIESSWSTLCARLERANNPLIILGPECWVSEWVEVIVTLSHEYRTALMASDELWGHLGSFEPEGMRGFYQLDTLDREDLFEFDNIFLFGVPAEYKFFEQITTHQDLSESDNVELFSLNSSALMFGDGRDSVPPPCMKQFFAHTPVFCSHGIVDQHIVEVEEFPLWYRIIASIRQKDSVFFVQNDPYVVSFFIQYQPFAKIFIQPAGADETWFLTAQISCENTTAPCFIAGNKHTIIELMNRAAFTSAVFLFLDDGVVEEVVGSDLVIELQDELSAVEWLSARKKPAFICIGEENTQ